MYSRLPLPSRLGHAHPVPWWHVRQQCRVLSRAADCVPVEAGYWAPTGAALREECFTGFFCPGAANDEENDPPGSKPIIVSVGSQTATVDVEVVEQVMTLDVAIESYNETAVKIELAALYGVPMELIDPHSHAGLASARHHHPHHAAHEQLERGAPRRRQASPPPTLWPRLLPSTPAASQSQ